MVNGLIIPGRVLMSPERARLIEAARNPETPLAKVLRLALEAMRTSDDATDRMMADQIMSFINDLFQPS